MHIKYVCCKYVYFTLLEVRFGLKSDVYCNSFGFMDNMRINYHGTI